jgi:hypothetical protein
MGLKCNENSVFLFEIQNCFFYKKKLKCFYIFLLSYTIQFEKDNKRYQMMKVVNDSMVSGVSIYLPHVFSNISKDDVARTFEDKFNIGKIYKIECIPKVNEKNGHQYYSCFIFFKYWYDNANTQYILYRLHNGEQTRLFYSPDKYWVICHNQSELAFLDNPIHTDLVIRNLSYNYHQYDLPALLDCLDLGQVNSFVVKEEIYQDKTVLNMYIHFDFWYRTQSSYAFQQIISQNNIFEITAFDDSKISFLYEKPKFDGINPNVWYSY